MKIYAFSFWVLGARDNSHLFIHTLLNQLSTVVLLHPAPFLPFILSGSFTCYFSLRIKAITWELSTSLPPLQNVCTFLVKGCLGFFESNTSSRSPNLSPCFPSDESHFFSWAHIFSCISNLPLSTSSVYRHIFLVPPLTCLPPQYPLITFSSLLYFLKKWCMLTTCLYLLTFYSLLTLGTMVFTPSALLRFSHPLLWKYEAVAQLFYLDTPLASAALLFADCLFLLPSSETSSFWGVLYVLFLISFNFGAVILCNHQSLTVDTQI